MHGSDLTVLLDAAVQVASYPPENAQPDTFACRHGPGPHVGPLDGTRGQGVVWTWGQ